MRAPMAAILFVAGCSSGFVELRPWLAVPQRVEARLVPGELGTVVLTVRNTGTAPASLRAEVDLPATMPEATFTIPADGSVDVRVSGVLQGYRDAESTVRWRVGADVWTTTLAWIAEDDADADGFRAVAAGGDDCDDLDPSVHPGAEERCNGRDDDCNGVIDDGLELFSVWPDADGDGFGADSAAAIEACAVADSFADQPGDCDDTNPDISPAAAEIWYDGVDQDCSGGSDFDQDADGFDHPLGGGADCDDTRADVYPSAIELDDGLDNDCDGFVDEDVWSAGKLVISEIFVEPVTGTPGSAEWVELVNGSAVHADLAQASLVVGGLPSPFPARVVGPGEVVVLCASTAIADNGGVGCDGAAAIPVGARDFAVFAGSTSIDEVDGAAFPFVPGRSLELGGDMLDAALNDAADAWCVGVAVFGDLAGDRGTPGVVRAACP